MALDNEADEVNDVGARSEPHENMQHTADQLVEVVTVLFQLMYANMIGYLPDAKLAEAVARQALRQYVVETVVPRIEQMQLQPVTGGTPN